MRKIFVLLCVCCILLPVASFALSADDPGVVAASAKKFNAGGAALGAIGVAAGTAGMIQSVSGNQQHSWQNVAQGALSGATTAASGAALINMIPGLGQVGYGAAIVVGTVIGGVVAGTQLFSETDCMNDPVTGVFTCCNTVFNKGQRQVDIGGYMFCTNDGKTPIAPGVRQCLQGGESTKTGSWWNRLWKNDTWSECVERFCNPNVLPDSGLDGVISWREDTENICWDWDCAIGTKVQVNGKKGVYTCVDINGNVIGSAETYDTIIKKIEALRQQLMKQCGSVQ